MQSPYTEKAKSVLHRAAKAARKSGQGYIGTEHILLGLYREENSVASRVLAENGMDEGRLLQLIQEFQYRFLQKFLFQIRSGTDHEKGDPGAGRVFSEGKDPVGGSREDG